MTDLAKLHAAIAAVAPIDGVNSDGVIAFRPDATPAQRTAAQAVLNGWDQVVEDAQVAALRSAIVTAAQSAVGVRVDALSAVQVRALVALLLWQSSAVSDTLTIRPLVQWVNP